MEYKPLEQNLEQGLSQLGNQVKSIPHIVIGKQDSISLMNNKEQNNIFNEKEQAFINKLKKWGIIIAVGVIVIYVIYRILV